MGKKGCPLTRMVWSSRMVTRLADHAMPGVASTNAPRLRTGTIRIDMMWPRQRWTRLFLTLRLKPLLLGCSTSADLASLDFDPRYLGHQMIHGRTRDGGVGREFGRTV